MDIDTRYLSEKIWKIKRNDFIALREHMYTNQASRQKCQLCLVTFQREPQPEGVGFVNRPCGSLDLVKNY